MTGSKNNWAPDTRSPFARALLNAIKPDAEMDEDDVEMDKSDVELAEWREDQRPEHMERSLYVFCCIMNDLRDEGQCFDHAFWGALEILDDIIDDEDVAS